jgi:SPP1 family predicted phage head-tail adaptor
MNPGELRQRLIFQKPSSSVDEDGFATDAPIEYAKAWAALKTLKGKNFYAAAQNNMEHNRQFIIRYQPKLDDAVRPDELKVMWKGIEHDIVSIENDNGMNQTMTVIVKAVS